MGRPRSCCGRAAICPILTLDAAKWRCVSADLDEPLNIIEITDPTMRRVTHGSNRGKPASEAGPEERCR